MESSMFENIHEPVIADSDSISRDSDFILPSDAHW